MSRPNPNAIDTTAEPTPRRHVVPKDLPNAVKYMSDGELDSLYAATLEEMKIVEADGAFTGAMSVSSPAVVGRAQAAVAQHGLSSRCHVVEGDFFVAVPEADIYLLDWDDE